MIEPGGIPRWRVPDGHGLRPPPAPAGSSNQGEDPEYPDVDRTEPNPLAQQPVTLGSMASSTRDRDSNEGEIRLWKEDDCWIAKDVETGVTTQGRTRDTALENLDEAVALSKGEAGRAPTDEELRELGIDPEENSTGSREPPDVLE